MRVGEIGKIINLATGFDLSGASTLSVVLTPPSGVKKTKTGSSVTAPAVSDPSTSPPLVADEYFQYTTEAGDIDESGVWGICGVYEDATPKKFYTDGAKFNVDESCE